MGLPGAGKLGFGPLAGGVAGREVGRRARLPSGVNEWGAAARGDAALRAGSEQGAPGRHAQHAFSQARRSACPGLLVPPCRLPHTSEQPWVSQRAWGGRQGPCRRAAALARPAGPGAAPWQRRRTGSSGAGARPRRPGAGRRRHRSLRPRARGEGCVPSVVALKAAAAVTGITTGIGRSCACSAGTCYAGSSPPRRLLPRPPRRRQGARLPGSCR